jgi:transposase InsO family protein
MSATTTAVRVRSEVSRSWLLVSARQTHRFGRTDGGRGRGPRTTCSTRRGKRDFTSTSPGTRLVGDITYVRTGEGWLYLATVIDLFSGMVLGGSMAAHMRASLCTAALQMARKHGHLTGASVVFHSDSEPSTPLMNSRNAAAITRLPSPWGKSGCAGTTPTRRTSTPT